MCYIGLDRKEDLLRLMNSLFSSFRFLFVSHLAIHEIKRKTVNQEAVDKALRRIWDNSFDTVGLSNKRCPEAQWAIQSTAVAGYT